MGGIQVNGSMRADMLVQAKVNAYAETEERAREIAASVRVEAASDRVSADGPRAMGRHEGWSVSYRIGVPTQTSLSLKSTNGGITVDGVEGHIEFATVNGGVKLANVNGDVRGRTSNGGSTSISTERPGRAKGSTSRRATAACDCACRNSTRRASTPAP